MAKRLEETTGALRVFADALFTRIKELTGSEPSFYPSNGWYKCADGTIFLFVRINGDPTRVEGCPPNSIELQAWWDDSWEDEEGVRKSPKALWGSKPAAEACYPAQPEAMDEAIKFVKTALELHRRKRRK